MYIYNVFEPMINLIMMIYASLVTYHNTQCLRGIIKVIAASDLGLVTEK